MRQEAIDVVMPIQEGRYIPLAVLRGLVGQDVVARLWTSTQYSRADFASARNNVKKYGRTDKVLMLDNDIVLPEGALSRMCQFLNTHKHYAAIALSKREKPVSSDEAIDAKHIDMSCVLFRRSMLERITFRQGSGTCECQGCCDDIRRMGLSIGLLTGVKADHIATTRLEPLT